MTATPPACEVAKPPRRAIPRFSRATILAIKEAISARGRTPSISSTCAVPSLTTAPGASLSSSVDLCSAHERPREVGGYIRSGDSIPNSPRPIVRTCEVSALNRSLLSLICSFSARSTGHCS